MPTFNPHIYGCSLGTPVRSRFMTDTAGQLMAKKRWAMLVGRKAFTSSVTSERCTRQSRSGMLSSHSNPLTRKRNVKWNVFGTQKGASCGYLIAGTPIRAINVRDATAARLRCNVRDKKAASVGIPFTVPEKNDPTMASRWGADIEWPDSSRLSQAN